MSHLVHRDINNEVMHMTDLLADVPVSPLVGYAARRAEREAEKAKHIELNVQGKLTSAKGVDYEVATYIDTKDVAKIIRRMLKAEHPGVKFSVRLDRYAGGSSIHVGWDAEFDAQTEKRNALSKKLRAYGSAHFDGMTDSSYHTSTWLHADGYTVSDAYSSGAGYDKGWDNPNPGGAKLVNLGCGYVFGQRRFG